MQASSNLPNCLVGIRHSLSDPRLDAYRTRASEDDLDLLARYAWNMALGSAMYGPLQLLEISLRNALHRSLTSHHNTDERWFVRQNAFPQNRGRWAGQPIEESKKVNEAIRRTVGFAGLASPDAPGKVVAALDFGFWTRLLTRGYATPASQSRNWTPLWPTLVPAVFPHLPNPTGTKRDRELLAVRFDNIRQLRNRVSHHEPIWKGRPDPLNRTTIGIDQQYDEIVEAIGWISQDLVHAVQALSTFHNVFASGTTPYRSVIVTLP